MSTRNETPITNSTSDAPGPPTSTAPLLPTSKEEGDTPPATKVADFPPPPQVAQEMGMSAYDDFEDNQFNGTFDSSHFSRIAPEIIDRIK